MIERSDDDIATWGELREGLHIAGYTFERACSRLERLLEGDRWKVGGRFEDVNAFLSSLHFNELRAPAEHRKRIAARIKPLQPAASNRQIARTLGVDEKTVRIDTAENSAGASKTAKQDKQAKSASAENSARVPSGAEAAKIVERARQRIVPGVGIGMHSHADRGLDLYETPAPATRALLAEETFDGPIWEPADGRSAISRVLREAGYHVIATDLVDYGMPNALGGVDFLAQTFAPEGAKIIVSNPPFMYADEFVRHALTLVSRVIFLLRLAYVEGTGRADILDGGQLARVYVFRNRLPMLHRDGWTGPRTNSSMMPLAWFVWDRHHRGPTELRRISWEADCDEAPIPQLGCADPP